MKEIKQEYYVGERTLFGVKEVKISDTIFGEGESPLKESEKVILEDSAFQWKYPLWYSKDITARNCTWFVMARAGVWYAEKISIESCAIEAPKNFRRCKELVIKNTSFAEAEETLWHCEDVTLEQVVAKGDYFAMNTKGLQADHLTLYGNYSFDGCRDVQIRNAKLLSKDAFWNSENVTVYDSYISGEYLGWNAKNLTLINCTIESLQGLCYIENLVMKNCKLLHTTLAFEYSTVEADISGKIDSVMNPSGGSITADEIGELILEKDRIQPEKTRIYCRG